MKKIIALITALAITISAFSGVMVVVADDIPSLEPTISSFKIDGEDYSAEMEYSPGDEIEAVLSWNVPPGVLEFQCNLGTDIQISESQGNIVEGGKVVGHWTFDNDTGTITIVLDEPATKCGVTLTGIIPLDPVEEMEGEAKDLEFGGQIFTITPSYNNGNVKVEKSVGANNSTYLNDKGQFVTKNTIKITVSDNYVSGINLNDVLGTDVEFPDGFGRDSIEVNYIPVIGPQDPNYGDYTLNPTDKKQFGMTLPGPFAPGDVIEITYETVISMDGMAKASEGDSSGTSNSVSGTFTDKKDSEEKSFNSATSQLYSFSNPSLSKYGNWEDEANGIIKWTITFDPGVYGNIDEYINDPAKLAELGINGLQEVLGKNQPVCDKNGDPVDLDLDILTLGQFKNVDNKLIFEFYTKADKSKSSYFSNDVSINVFGTVEKKASASVGDGLKITKTAAATEPNADDGTMDWSVTIDVPKGEFDSITITDTPDDNYNDKRDYIHSIIEGSIRIGNDTIETAKANGVTVTSTSEHGVIIVLPYEYAKQFTTLTITFQTKAEKDGSVVGAFEGTYNWQNRAEYYVTYGDKQNGPVYASASYSKQDTSLSLTKGIKDGKQVEITEADGTITKTTMADWYVEVNNFAIFSSNEWSGSLFSEEGLTLDLTDTLPDNMEYVEGSAYAVPSLYVDYYDQDIIKKYNYVNRAKDLFSQGLEIVNDGAALKITWSDADLKQQFQDFIQSTELDYVSYKVSPEMLFSGGTSFRIYYRTQVKDIEKFLEGNKDEWGNDRGGQDFINKVNGTINGNSVSEQSATVWVAYENALTKTSKYTENGYNPDRPGIPYNNEDWLYSTNTELPNVPFDIDVNPQRLSLGENGTLIVVDTMGASLKLLEETVILTNVETGEEEQCIKITSKAVESNRTEWSFVMKDGIHYRLTYFCEMIDEPTREGSTPTYGDIKDGTNSVKFKLHQDAIASQSTRLTNVVIPLGWATSGAKEDIRLTKVDSSDKTKFLDGAEFEFCVVEYDANTDKFTPVPNTQSNGKKSKDGVTFFGVNDPTKEIYMIKETKEPDGYVLDENAHYYICPNYNGEDKDYLIKNNKVELLDNKDANDYYQLEFPNTKENYNEPKPETSSLKITKTVTGDGAKYDENEFSFTVTLTDEDDKLLTNKELNLEVKNSEDKPIEAKIEKTNENIQITFYLKNGESAIISGIPVGTHYDICENNENGILSGYSQSALKETGNITPSTNEVSYTNTRKVGSLSISKTVEKATAEDKEKSFKFTVTLTDENKNALAKQTFDVEWTNADSNAPKTVTTNGNGEFTVDLSNNQKITIKGLPENTHYKVEETQDSNYKSEVPDGKDEGYIIADQIAEVPFTNTRIGSLSISKTVVGAPAEDQEKSFDFTVTLTDENGYPIINTEFVTNNSEEKVVTNTYGEFTVSLSDGKTITIKGLPVNTQYEITEAPYENYTSEGKNAKGSIKTEGVSVSFVNTYNQSQGTDTDDDNGDNSSDNNSSDPEKTPDEPDGEGGDGDETPDSNGSNSESEKEPSFDIPTIPSTPQDTTKPVGGSLTVSKTVAGDGAEADREFTFTIEFKNADGTVVTDYFSYGGSKSGTIKSGDTFTLKHGESITITNLPDGVIYNVSEVETDGYISKSTDSSGIVYAGQSHSASFVNEAVTTSEETTTTVAVETCYGDDSSDVTESSVTVSDSSIAESTSTDRNSAVDGYGDSKDKIPNTANKGDQNIMFMFISLAAAFTGTTAILIRRKKSR